MPIRKFRSAAEMNRPIWRTPGDPSLYRAMAALWGSWRPLGSRRARPGVYKFRSIEELDRATKQYNDSFDRRADSADITSSRRGS